LKPLTETSYSSWSPSNVI